MEKEKTKDIFFSLIIFFIFLTSSFDIFLTLKIGGFTLRISQIICVFLIGLYAINIGKSKKIKLPIGYKTLISWFFILILFTFNTVLPSMNIAYNMWLFFNIIIIFIFNELGTNKKMCERIIKLYIISFFIMAIIGIGEFILGIIGIKVPFITQWWIRNKLPRINGFSYEPSYYATYLIIGWTFCRELLQKNSKIIQKLNIIVITITVAIILSSSRIGILFMIIYEIMILGKNMITFKHTKYIFLIFILGIIAIIILVPLIRKNNLKFLLNGTGLNGATSHSVINRESDFKNVIKVFKKSPLFGKGLGGIYAEIAINNGINIHNVQVQKVASGTSVFAEILAGSGIIGFIFFIIYIFILVRIPCELKNENINNEYKIIMNALVSALIMVLLILQFNQNILRMYLWIHIAVLTMYYRLVLNQIKENDKK